MRKILTAQIKGEIYFSLVCSRLFTEKQKRLPQEKSEESVNYYTWIITWPKRWGRMYLWYGLTSKNVSNMVPQTWIIESPKIYKISDKVVNIIAEAMKNNEKIQKGIFQGDSLSSFLFVIEMTTLTKKRTGRYKFTKSQEKINHFMYMKAIKLFAKKRKRTGDFDKNNKNIQPGYRN